MKLDTAPYKGVRDFYPEDQFIQNYIFSIWRKALESFGYEEYGASVLEPSELYRAKSGEEIVSEQTYTFMDRGERSVTLRPEMTPTVARMVSAKRREIGLPLRWFSIPNLFRYESPQRGRLREHWQLNTDIFGISNVNADIEIIKIAWQIMRNFGASESEFEIRLSDRSLLDNYLLAKGVAADRIGNIRRILDKKDRLPNFEEKFREAAGKEISLDIPMNPDVITILEALENAGISNARFEPTLVRGFDYYTGTIFEIFDTNPENPRSIFGGGRYDNLTDLFGEEKIAAVGFGAGDVTTRDFLEARDLLPEYQSKTDLYIALTSLDLAQEADKLAQNLREAGCDVTVDYSGKKIGDQIKIADKRKVPFILVFGEDELKSGNYSVKELLTGNETSVDAGELLELLKNPR